MTERDRAIEALDLVAGCGCCTYDHDHIEYLDTERGTTDREHLFGLILDRYHQRRKAAEVRRRWGNEDGQAWD